MLRHKSLHPLSHQHHNGLALCVLGERSLASDPSPANIAHHCRRAVDRYELELRNHFELEETLLFPAIENELGTHDLVQTLIAEHRQMEQFIGQLRAQPQLETLTAFYSLLRTHIRKEENELFEEIQGRLSPETLTALGPEFESRAIRICLEP